MKNHKRNSELNGKFLKTEADKNEEISADFNGNDMLDAEEGNTERECVDDDRNEGCDDVDSEVNVGDYSFEKDGDSDDNGKLSPKKKKIIALIISGILIVGLIIGGIVGVLYGISTVEISIEVHNLETIKARIGTRYYVPSTIQGDDPEAADYYETQFSVGSLMFKGVLSETAALEEKNNDKIYGYEIVFLDKIKEGNGYVVYSNFNVKKIESKDLKDYVETVIISSSLRLFVCINNEKESESIVELHFMIMNKQYFSLKGKCANNDESIKSARDNLAGVARAMYNDYLLNIPNLID